MTITALPPFAPDPQIPEYDYVATLGSASYRLRLRWMERLAGWYLSIWDSDGEALALNKRMTVDWPLLARHTGRRPPGGFLALVDISGVSTACAYDDLGHRCQFCWVTEDEFDESETPALNIEVPT